MQVDPAKLDTIGRLADQLESGLAGLKLPLSDDAKLESLAGVAREVRDALAQLYRDMSSGEDPWANNPLES